MKNDMDKKTCIGCVSLITDDAELYYDKRLSANIGVMRFYTHLKCLKSGATQQAADGFFARAVAGLEKS